MVAIAHLQGLDEMIVCDPDFREGRPHLAGTGISVGRIGVLYSIDGLSAEQIAEDKTISLEQAYTALAYYLRNREAIDADLIAQDEEMHRIAEEYRRTGKLPVD